MSFLKTVLAAALAVFLAHPLFACSSSDQSLGETNATCAGRGGSCVAIFSSSCASGVWLDATQASCADVGVRCCVPKTAPTSSCELAGGRCTGLNPSACDGDFDATNYPCGGGGVGCCLPKPNLAPISSDPKECASAGGTCVAITPTSCPSGNWADARRFTCDTGLGVGCCLP
jgi:hypothetical protein